MQAIVINQKDNVAVALADLKKDQVIVVDHNNITLKDDIQRGHKFAIKAIAQDDQIIKYGYPIGRAKSAIAIGEHVHTHNVRTDLKASGVYTYEPLPLSTNHNLDLSFKGYKRENGEVGIRNELWIIPTVFCVNHVAKELELYANSILEKFKNVDRAIALSHPYGCSQMGEDQKTTQKVLASLAKHPNAGAVIIIGLGCENNNLNEFKKFLDLNDTRLLFLNAQDVEDEVETGEALVNQALTFANNAVREDIPISKLKIGLKCGGSDGLSGITANPLIGKLSDLIVGAGGISVMTEVPEMFGAEQLLMNRCKDEDVFNKCINLINNFKAYFTAHGQVVSENPSPGNKAGGITTLEDKSLGCVQKGGSATVNDVIDYASQATVAGLNLLQGPGSDGVSCTALACAGCHIILFSTGRGTPFATVVPTIKISTNNALYEKKSNWIDFNAGEIVNGAKIDDVANQLLEYVISIASGSMSKSEQRGIHEIIIWKDGVTL